MGNFMNKQIIFKNLKFPKLKSTQPPKQLEGGSLQINNKNNLLKWHLDSTIPLQNHYDLYQFKTKKSLQRSSFGVYEMPTSITILTYNIWFEQKNRNNRFECILKLLQLSNADFICLQEVTQDFVYMLHSLPKESWIKNYYTGVTPMQWYDTIILSKFKCKFFKTPFKNSFMSRSATFAQLMTKDGQNLIIGSMHYESLDGNQKIREQQIFQVQQSTYKCSRVIIAGDYNFSDNYQQNKIISKEYTDIWIHVHKLGQNRYTMPQTPKFAPWRPDHVLCKVPKNVSLQKAEIQKIGQFSIPPFEHQDYLKIGSDNIVRTPSDHFGLFSWIPLV